MRKSIISIVLVAVLTTAALASGCSVPGLGNTVTEGKDFTGFSCVDVGDVFEVEIVQSDSFSTTITADDVFADYIAVSKEGETLKIYLNPRHNFTDFTLGVKTLKAKITMPALHGIRLSGATRATITGFKSTQDFSLDISGASSLVMDNGNIEVGNADITISGASEITGSLKAKNVKFEASGDSKVELKGSAEDAVLNASGASKVNLTDFILNNANVKLSGDSEVTVNAKGKLDAAVSEASTLYFLGNPSTGDVSVTGASTIKHK